MDRESYENDVRREDYMSDKNRHLQSIELRKAEIDIAEREQGLLERKNREAERVHMVANREFATHMANMKMLNHHGKQYEEMIEKDAEEAVAANTIFRGENFKHLVEMAVAEAFAKHLNKEG